MIGEWHILGLFSMSKRNSKFSQLKLSEILIPQSCWLLFCVEECSIFSGLLIMMFSLSQALFLFFPGVLLTMLSLMRALDSVKHQEEMAKCIDKLPLIDPMRSSYYADLRELILSKISINVFLFHVCEAKCIIHVS